MLSVTLPTLFTPMAEATLVFSFLWEDASHICMLGAQNKSYPLHHQLMQRSLLS
jgi:hypothetical protein